MLFLRKRIVVIFMIAILFCFMLLTFSLYFYEHYLEGECKKGIATDNIHIAVKDAQISLLRGTIFLQGVTAEVHDELGGVTLSIEHLDASEIPIFSLSSLTPILLAKKVSISGVHGNIVSSDINGKLSIRSVSFGEVWGALGLFKESSNPSSALLSLSIHSGWLFGFNAETLSKGFQSSSLVSPSSFSSKASPFAVFLNTLAHGAKGSIELLRFSLLSATTIEKLTAENIRIENTSQGKISLATLHLDKANTALIGVGIPLPLLENLSLTRMRVQKSKQQDVSFASLKVDTGVTYKGATIDFLLGTLEFSGQMYPDAQNIVKRIPREGNILSNTTIASKRSSPKKEKSAPIQSLSQPSKYALTVDAHILVSIGKDKQSDQTIFLWKADPFVFDVKNFFELSGKVEGKMIPREVCPLIVTDINTILKSRNETYIKQLTNNASCLDSRFIDLFFQRKNLTQN